MLHTFFDNRQPIAQPEIGELAHYTLNRFNSLSDATFNELGHIMVGISSKQGERFVFNTTYPSTSFIGHVDHLDVGNEALRFSAIMRSIVQLFEATSCVVIAQHPDLAPAGMEDAIAVFEQDTKKNYHYSSLNDVGDIVFKFAYDHIVREWDYSTDKATPSTYLALAGFTNLYDQEYFLKNHLSLSFSAAAIKHANELFRRVS